MERDPAQAERFYGNRIVVGSGAWIPEGLWESVLWTGFLSRRRGRVCVSASTVRTCRTGRAFVVRPVTGFCSRRGSLAGRRCGTRPSTAAAIPRAEVDAAVDELFSRFEVRRFYCDPPGWRTEIEAWALRHGEERVVEWPTYRPLPMHAALERFLTDLSGLRVRHDGCPDTARHMANARVSARKDGRYMLTKPDRDRKIDAAVTSVLAHEAAADERAAGWPELTGPTYFRLPR